MKITTVESSGDYSGMGGPLASPHGSVPNFQLLGAIIEGPGGNVFVKFTGPAKTVSSNRAKFDQLIASFQPAK